MKARMVLRPDGDDRERHLNALARFLGPGESIVVSIDTYREGDATLNVPLDPTAEVVALEPPKLKPDGLTEIVSYVVCRSTTAFRRVRVALSEGVLEEGSFEMDAARRGAAA